MLGPVASKVMIRVNRHSGLVWSKTLELSGLYEYLLAKAYNSLRAGCRQAPATQICLFQAQAKIVNVPCVSNLDLLRPFHASQHE
jgi:hypothetical protein